MALSCAVTYPFGVIGVIFGLILLRKWFVKPHHLKSHSLSDEDHTYIAQFEVTNQQIDNKKLIEIGQMTPNKFIVSRIWRDGHPIVPSSHIELKLGDNVLVATTDKDVDILTALFGKKSNTDWNKEKIDWDHIDTKLESEEH